MTTRSDGSFCPCNSACSTSISEKAGTVFQTLTPCAATSPASASGDLMSSCRGTTIAAPAASIPKMS
jgi:hypothetical protein